MNADHRGSWCTPNWRLAALSVIVLLICSSYTYAAAYLAPHPGLAFNSGWVIDALEACPVKATWCAANSKALQVGDQLLAVGGMTLDDFWSNRRRIPFGGYSPGDVVSITFRRAGEERAIDWHMLGPTLASQTRRLAQGVLVVAPFWLAGTAVLLFLQPRDLRWRILISTCYVTAVWLAVGLCSHLRVAYASLGQHALAWLLAPIPLHLHLVVPSPLLRRHRRYLLLPLYAIAVALAGLELFQLLPRTASNLALLLGSLGSLGLLIYRLASTSPKADKLAARLMFAGITVGLGPSIVLWIIPTLLGMLIPRGLAFQIALLAVPLVAPFYIYAIYKRHLGTLEFRANRILSTYSFAILYATLFVLIFTVGSLWLELSNQEVLFGLAVSIAFVVAGSHLRVQFQRLIDRLAYGTEHNPDDIIRVFANQIPAAVSLEALAELLAGEVAPSLLIRQSALCLIGDERTDLCYARGVGQHELPDTRQPAARLLAGAGRYRAPSAAGAGALSWVRLVIPVQARGETTGLWLFGRRDPDDYYPESDIELLSTLARQVAVAVENIRLFQQAQQEIAQRRLAEAALKSRLEQLDALRQASRAVTASLELDQVMDAILEQMQRVVAGDAFNLALVEQGNARMVRWRGYAERDVPKPVSTPVLQIADCAYLARMMETGNPVIVLDAAEDPDWVSPDGQAWQSYIAAPIRLADQTIGFLNVSGRRPGQYDLADAGRLQLFADTAAVAIENARLYQEIREHSEFLEQRVRERTAEIQAQYAQLDAILNSASDGIIVADRQGETIRANPLAEAWLRQTLSVANAVRLRVAVRDLAVKVGAAEPPVAGPWAGGLAPATLELDGMDLELRAASISPAGDENAVTVVSIHDVSHLKALDRVKTRFITNVSHELRTPVTTIILYVHLMQRASEEESEAHLATLAREADHLAHLVDNVLELASIDAERINVRLRPTALSELVELACVRHQGLAGERGLTLETDIADGGPMALVDPEHMMQVLSNLIENAIHYTPAEGKVAIRTGTERAEGRTWATVTVADTGFGIAEEELPNLFERFFRGEKPMTMHIPGTGLGLSIAKEIVDLHGGRLTVESKEEEGTSFTVWLPHVEAET